MRVLLPLPVIACLLGAGASMAFGRNRIAQRIIGSAALLTALGAAIGILRHVDADGPAAAFMGGWKAPVGIALVADRFTAIMLLVSAVVLLGVLMFAMGQPGTEQEQPSFHPVYLVLAAGVFLSFLTGDLFNLFVAFEMMLTASYILITLGGRLDQVQTGMTYVVISLIASTLFVTALALVYSATGTVNLADLSQRMEQLSPGLRTAFSVLLLVVFGIKAGLFPLFFWLPDSYPTAPSAVTAVFAGLLTKVGVYAIIRTQTLLFPPESRPSTLILVLAGATMVVGVLGAIAQDDVKRILSFHIVSHVGFMVMGLGFFTVAGLGAGLVAAAALFLASYGETSGRRELVDAATDIAVAVFEQVDIFLHALGADAARVTRLVVVQALGYALAGLVVGLVAATPYDGNTLGSQSSRVRYPPPANAPSRSSPA